MTGSLAAPRLLSTDRRLLGSIACGSFVVSTGELAIVRAVGLPDIAYIAIMLLTVPPATFLLAKLWAFSPRTQGL